MQTHPLRLRPGDDLRVELDALAHAEGWGAACVLTAVGSLTHAALRLANQTGITTLEGPFEIVSLAGTLGPGGSHLHLAVSDASGLTRGGHLVQGCTVFTTAELVLGVLEGWRFDRQPDPETGFDELVVESD